MRITEGNPYPGNSLTGDELPEPKYCPACGRALRQWGWTTVYSATRYPWLVCYGSKPSWLVWLHERFALVEPSGAHYGYQLPQHPVVPPSPRFDRDTGEQFE